MGNKKMSPESVPMFESLEQRRLLSASLHTERVHKPLPPGFGGLGDSFTDEYEFAKGRNFALNYVEQLAQANIGYFGPFTQTPRPDLRGAGYAYDWGLSGATSGESGRRGPRPRAAGRRRGCGICVDVDGGE